MLTDYEDHLRFASCWALVNAVYKAVLCLFRKYSGQANPDKYGSILAGFLSGLFLKLDDSKKRRHFIAILLLSRLTDIVLNLLMQNAYVSKENEERNQSGVDKNSKHLIIMFMFALGLCQNAYTTFFEPDLNDKTLMKMGIRMGTIDEWLPVTRVWHEQNGTIMDYFKY